MAEYTRMMKIFAVGVIQIDELTTPVMMRMRTEKREKNTTANFQVSINISERARRLEDGPSWMMIWSKIFPSSPEAPLDLNCWFQDRPCLSHSSTQLSLE